MRHREKRDVEREPFRLNGPIGRGTTANRIWGLTPFFLAFFLAGCAGIDPHNVIGRQMPGAFSLVPNEVVPSGSRPILARDERVRAFDFVWQTIEERYYDPRLNGVDWSAMRERYRPRALEAADDEAFWDMLDRMTGELKDSHTRVESPRRAEMRKRDETISLGFGFMPVEGKLAVTSIAPDSDAWWAGVRPGMIVASIDGEQATAAYERLLAETRYDSTDRSRQLRAVRRLVTGPEGSIATFTFQRADGSLFEARVARRKLSTRAFAVQRVLPSGFGYLRFTQWTLGVMPRVYEALESLHETPGLVIDLRGNPGGSLHMVNAVLGRFFREKAQLGRILTRTGRPVSLLFGTVEVVKLRTVVEANPEAYRGAVVILVNAQSASASELFAATMQASGRASVVGEPSCGCLLGFLGYATIPGGGELAYSEIGFVMSNGLRIEGEGVIPDRLVPVTLPDLVVSRDRTLEEAQRVLAAARSADPSRMNADAEGHDSPRNRSSASGTP
jgi:carboxyl-terminal processing protease